MASIDRLHPGLLVLLIDQSSSMNDRIEGGSISKIDALRRIVNRFLERLIDACKRSGSGPFHHLDVALIGYTTTRADPSRSIIGSVLQGHLEPGSISGEIVSVAELYRNLYMGKDHQDAGAGGEPGPTKVSIFAPIWSRSPDPEQMGDTPTVAAFEHVRGLVEPWCVAHPDGVPPLVIHLTDGESTDGDPEPEARKLLSLSSSAGNLRLCNVHLSASRLPGTAFPVEEGQLNDPYARTLFHVSSEVPRDFSSHSKSFADPPRDGARFMFFNIFIEEFEEILSLFLPWILVTVGTIPQTADEAIPSPPDLAPRSPLAGLDQIQFTVYRPKVVRPREWYPMLAFAHLADRRPDAPEAEPDPIQQVRDQAVRLLGPQVKQYRDTSSDARQAIPRESTITLTPDVPGVEFNPERRTFRWTEDVHREEFRLCASAGLNGTTTFGRISAHLGAILLAEVELAIRVDSSFHSTDKAVPAVTTRPYRKIFASYSHKDLEIVHQYEWFVESLGDKYLRDVRDLRAGEDWDEALVRLIEAADVFQLFWSSNAMRSPFVRREWEYALSLGRRHFIRPTYWEVPLPESPDLDLPPKTLRRLHFHRIHSESTAARVAATPEVGPPAVPAPDPSTRKASSASSSRIRIRCPNCQKAGSARAELINRRVSCKHCSHVFRAVPVDDEVPPLVAIGPALEASPPLAREPISRREIEALELEVRRLRDNLSARPDATEEAEVLRSQLDQARYARDKAEAHQASLHEEVERLRDELGRLNSTGLLAKEEPKNRLREEELRSLRDQLDKARRADEARKANDEKIHRAEIEALSRELEKARSLAEAASRSKHKLAAQIPASEAIPASSSSIDPEVLEAERKKAVDEAVKGAWADFERRLAETQARLKAANFRADMMELEAREALGQIAGLDEDVDLGDGSSSEEVPSISSIRILEARGDARLTPDDAEARLALARQLAIARKDKALIDRIFITAEKVKADLEARNYTLAETLVRGAEIETGLDPGGFSIGGLRIFRSSPTILGSLTALAPTFDRVMRQGDLTSIRSTLEEMRTILGDQAGLPELRRAGRTPAIKRPITRPEAVRLFLGALDGETWLVRPISTKKPLPETSLKTYAALIEGCCLIRESAKEHAPDRVSFLDAVIQASCLMIARRQRPDGHFSFLDPRGKPSKAATVVDGMVAQRPDAVEDGWVIHVDPIGMAQTETGTCAEALASAGKALGRAEWTEAARMAANWAVMQPCLPSFVANAASASLLAWAYLDARQDRHLAALTRKLSLGILPGQVENGRWIDASSATTPNHLAILRALHDAWEVLPVELEDLRRDLKTGIDLAMATLLAESEALGVPPQGDALRVLLRHRELFKPASESRIEAAILDSVTVIQELCLEGHKPRLGVAPDLLAALARV